MTPATEAFDSAFAALAGPTPMRWQRRLFGRFMQGQIPAALDLPTGLGKTSVMAIWLIARAHGADLPRRLVYVVDRRAVVDQATDEAEKLRLALEGDAVHLERLEPDAHVRARALAAELKRNLGLVGRLPISTLRGAHVDNREWLDDPTSPAIVVGTVDMIGSRLLFEGYSVSRRMRPYQAGLLGVDSLVVLDEAHLAPPFAHLLRTVEGDASLKAAETAPGAELPPFVFLPLSATPRYDADAGSGREPFGLEDEDRTADAVAARRIEATKRLSLVRLDEKNQDRQLAVAAWELAHGDGKPSRVVVFCDRRDRKDGGDSPSAQGVRDEIARLAKTGTKAGRREAPIHEPELLVGARRVRDREATARRLGDLGFLGTKAALDKPAFLIATSAGEVGVDIDADHMVSDLVAWERMVQRFGRVNRRGDGNATICVFWREPWIKDARAPSEPERRALLGFAARSVIERLPRIGGGFDASPGALRELAVTARGDRPLDALIRSATTREPLRPALTRALLDAWSMTSLKVHPGRPEVGPWLRGWAEEDRPQTTVLWRTHLPVAVDGSGSPVDASQAQVDAFFEAAPPHLSEGLETETWRVTDWLRNRARVLLRPDARSRRRTGQADDTGSEVRRPNVSDESGEPLPNPDTPGPDDIVALILDASRACIGRYTLGELSRKLESDTQKTFARSLSGRDLVLDARFGGLGSGLLDADADDLVPTADDSNDWSRAAGFRVRRAQAGDDAPEDPWRFEGEFVRRRDENGEISERLVIEHLADAAQGEEARSIAGRAQTLAQHQEWTAAEARRIAAALGLAGFAEDALTLAAELHDEGKRALQWQRAFQAARDARRFSLAGPLAKTRGPIDQAILGGYRHEFGSLPYAERHRAVVAMSEEWRDLVLHLVASHHGQGRPAIDARGCADGPPSALEERARSVALRFARLQKRWGPWGLAWWEALLHAADRRASRRLEQAL